MNATDIVQMKGLRLDVVRSRTDCTLSGISSTHDTLTLVGILDESRAGHGFQPLDDYSRVFPVRDDAPAVVLVLRHVFSGKPSYSLRPVGEDHEGRWYMMGGNYATGDSRFSAMHGESGAIPIHDRHEG